ncbi:hypothetical protein P154DRAFT_208921 [Amniculicola lignicola CBS 123094]|uniref:Nuclear matrix protein n=1 Tax=Amniculicola lignicola CBS 123094 TaxID=1392246 RepID=A0A6A5WIW1_9PLEO|nr:hypothetical protein P154DRAFT_208921 [Amniculicola lignicola CBS 123094]
MAGLTVVPDDIRVKIIDLLAQAARVKNGTSINPPLPVAEVMTDPDPFFGGAATGVEKELFKSLFEAATRLVFNSIIASIDIDHSEFVTMWNFLDIILECGDRDICQPQLMLLLIEELLDDQPVDGCRKIFDFLESRREAIIAASNSYALCSCPILTEQNSSKNKDLVILRLCNELLRRLSRLEDAVFCGRVYIFLFQSFPLGDKSSVNLRGNFHTENVTRFEDSISNPKADSDAMDIDKNPEVTVSEPMKTDGDGAAKDAPQAMDIDDLYPVFWSLQRYFSNPPLLFGEENFKKFQQGLEAALMKFKEVPTVIQSGDSDRKPGIELDDKRNNFTSTFTPKYLTSRDLFKLELSDLAFQRHILVQALILVDFLLTLREESKKKPFYQSSQKAMQYSFTLGEQQTEWALGIKTSIANYLQDGPDGKFYYRMVDTVLSRDKNWVRWKMENCPPFTLDRIPVEDWKSSQTGLQGALGRKKITVPQNTSDNLDFLYNTDPAEGLRKLRGNTKRYSKPGVEVFVNRVRDVDMDLDMATTEDERGKLDEKKRADTWRGLRLASEGGRYSIGKSGRDLTRLLQPAKIIEATGEDNAVTAPESRDSLPHEQHQSVEEQRAD